MGRLESIKERLKEGYYIKSNPTWGKDDSASKDVEWLIRRLERYEKALNFYGDEQNYDKWTCEGERVTNVTRDKGNVAKEALKEENRGGLLNPDGGDYPLKWMSEPKE